MAGVRLYGGAAVFGLDGIRIRNGRDGDRGHANGFLFGIGLGGRPGKYATAVSAGAAAVLGIVALVALGGAGVH